MLGKTHLLAAATVFIGLYTLGFISKPLFFFLGLFIGSLFPDIDSQTSILGRKVKFLSFFLKHRGFFHSPILLILLLVVIYPIHPGLAIGFATGFILHVLLDMITKEGITLPFLGKRKGPLRVGSWQEHIFQLLLIIIIFYFLIS